MVNLNKIELTKKGQSINLEKKNAKIGRITVNLNWNQQVQKPSGGFLSSLFGGKNNGTDLDLGCLFELKNGDKGCVQALGNSFGNYQNWPYIELDGDDRTGSISNGENLRINGDFLKEIKRIVIFTFIYQGVTNWAQADGVVTLSYEGGQDIIVRLDEHRSDRRMCAIALIENVNDETFKVERLVEYFNGHENLDRAYGWGMNWTPGRK
ncbi:TerD family protein [Lysinibacillus odysseyi]|uniref:Tellurium resistance n=1 Tax=Lysinibacillus odysseyi 34hs-1 = NBRC 100172 TaxID=1220589 RepID=A0A0A3ISB6_9BACI|nr:TerD family protein [Lysinibacillus odysseyi]KGR85753.1 Tellurium resistance [Lysinibacillus odysseyi 34hs-1 = NBRC 100172]